MILSLSKELDSLIQSLVSSQKQTHELQASKDALISVNERLAAEIARLRVEQKCLLETVSCSHKAAREDLQLSAAYSQSLQALSYSKAQVLEIEHSSKLQVVALQRELLQARQAVNVLQSTVTQHEKEAGQAKSQFSSQLQSLQNSHNGAMNQLQADLSKITEQLKEKDKECEAKRIHIANDQKTANLLKSKLASVRTELMRMQQQG